MMPMVVRSIMVVPMMKMVMVITDIGGECGDDDSGGDDGGVSYQPITILSPEDLL